MVASYTSKFDHVVYNGQAGTLVLIEDRITFLPTNKAKKKPLHWNWSVVKSHKVEVAAYKPTWSISVTVRGSIQETMKFEVDNRAIASKIQFEATQRSGLEGGPSNSTAVAAKPKSTFVAAAGQQGDSSSGIPPPIDAHSNHNIEALKHQIFDSKDTPKAVQNKDLETLDSVHVSDLRKKLGAMLPKPPAVAKVEPPKEDPFQRKLKDARRSLNSSMNLDYDGSEHENNNKGPAKLDPQKQKLLMAKLNLHHRQPQQQKHQQSSSSQSPPKARAFRHIDDDALAGSSNNNNNAVVRPRPMFLQELNKSIPTTGASTSGMGTGAAKQQSIPTTKRPPGVPSFLQELKSTDQSTQLKAVSATKERASASSGRPTGPPTLMGELQAKLASQKKNPSKKNAAQVSNSARQSSNRSTDDIPPLVSLVATKVTGAAPQIIAAKDTTSESLPTATTKADQRPKMKLQDDTMLVAPQNLEELSNINRSTVQYSDESSWKDGASNDSTDDGVLVVSLTAPPAGWTVNEKSSSEGSGSDGDKQDTVAPPPPPEEYPEHEVNDKDDEGASPPAPPPNQNVGSGWVMTAFLAAICCVVIIGVVLALTLGNSFGSDDDNNNSSAPSLAPAALPNLPVPTLPTQSVPTEADSPGLPTLTPATLGPAAGSVSSAPVGTTASNSPTLLPIALADPTTIPAATVPTTQTIMPSAGGVLEISPTTIPDAATISPLANLTMLPTLSPTVDSQIATVLPTSSPVSTDVPSVRTSGPTQLSTDNAQSGTADLPTTLDTPISGTFVEFPDYTQAAFENPESAQSLARNWLLEDPNINTYEEWRQLQRFALGTFFYSFNGGDWPLMIQETWMSYEGSECDWFSEIHIIIISLTDGSAEMTTTMDADASICDDNGRYTTLAVYNGEAFGTPFHSNFVSAFVGTMPPEVSLLTSLKSLAVHTDVNVLGVSMGDLLPTQFQALTNLTDLDLSDSFLKEWDFEALLNIPAVASLDVSNSDFEGTLPAGLGLMTKLTQLDVSDSYGNGNQAVPSEIGLLTILTHLSLSNNGLTGLFPFEFGSLQNLQSLQLRDSQMQDFPPAALSNLKILDMQSNNLGSIPAEIAFFTLLQHLNLSNNGMIGSLPIEIGLLTNLETMNIFRNSMTGSIPVEMSLATSLRIIDFEANLLTGTIPSEIMMSMMGLQQFSVKSNSLTGSLSIEVGRLTSMEALILGDNLMTGLVPTQIGLLTNLFILDVETNELSGSLPWADLSLDIILYYLSVSGNQLTGTIGTEIGLMTELSLLNLSRNRLDGSIPTEIGLLSGSLSELILDWNLLSGCIPSEVGMLTALKIFTSRGYTLQGTIPEEVGGMQNLEIFLLGGNPLTGTLPTTLGLLSSLDHLSLNLTTITGTIPSELGTVSSLNILYLNGTDLVGSVPAEVCSLPEMQVLAVDCASVVCDCGCNCFG